MKWEAAGPCAITSGAYTISRAPQPGYIWFGTVCYELTRAGEPTRMIRCADTAPERLAAVKLLKRLAEQGLAV